MIRITYARLAFMPSSPLRIFFVPSSIWRCVLTSGWIDVSSSPIVVDAHGQTAGTIEHIEPSAHGGGDDVQNLALACARCNQRKGSRLDHRRRDDPTLTAVIETLKERRRDRWREDDRVVPSPAIAPRGRRRR
jgi:hypothetical protein